MNHAEELLDGTETDIAIVGMAGRFPGADNVEAFWRNLRDGVESINFFT
jgi:acyl transferase domain-containing protein